MQSFMRLGKTRLSVPWLYPLRLTSRRGRDSRRARRASAGTGSDWLASILHVFMSSWLARTSNLEVFSHCALSSTRTAAQRGPRSRGSATPASTRRHRTGSPPQSTCARVHVERRAAAVKRARAGDGRQLALLCTRLCRCAPAVSCGARCHQRRWCRRARLLRVACMAR